MPPQQQKVILECVAHELFITSLLHITDADFAPVNGLYTYTLTIPAGESSVYLNTIEIIDDLEIEVDEMFFISLIEGTEAEIDIARMLVSVTIYDNNDCKYLYSV